VIIVRTPSGVTATLRKNLRALKPQQHYEYDRFVDGRLGQLWMSPESWVAYAEMSLAIVNRGCHFASDGKGTNTVFAKDGSNVGLYSSPDSTVFHEPFVVATKSPHMSRDGAKSQGLTFIAVPAIRPSFLDHALRFRIRQPK
jgi:hypothetical protein